MKIYFIPKFSEIGIYKIDEVEYSPCFPEWIPSEEDCFFSDKQILYHGTSVMRIKVDRLEFYVNKKEIQKYNP